MSKYMVPGNQATLTSAYKSAAIVTATTGTGILRRGRVAEIIIGQSANPNATDTYVQWDLSRCTTTGTATALTPVQVDPADVASGAAGGINATVEPTVTASSSMFNVGINQRGSMRWQEIDENKMPCWPATASNGVSLRGQSSTYTGSVTGQIGFFE